jgi:hypothetical protein
MVSQVTEVVGSAMQITISTITTSILSNIILMQIK